MFDELTKRRFPDWNAVNMSAPPLFTVIPTAVRPPDTPHSSWM